MPDRRAHYLCRQCSLTLPSRGRHPASRVPPLMSNVRPLVHSPANSMQTPAMGIGLVPGFEVGSALREVATLVRAVRALPASACPVRLGRRLGFACSTTVPAFEGRRSQRLVQCSAPSDPLRFASGSLWAGACGKVSAVLVSRVHRKAPLGAPCNARLKYVTSAHAFGIGFPRLHHRSAWLPA